MIRVELPVLVFIYLFVFLAAVFSLWIVYERLRQRREKEAGDDGPQPVGQAVAQAERRDVSIEDD